MKRLTLDEQIATLEGHNVHNQKLKANMEELQQERIKLLIDHNAQVIESLRELKRLKEEGIKNG